MAYSNKITIELFCEICGVNINDLNAEFIKKINDHNLSFRFLNELEHADFISNYEKLIYEETLKKSSPDRQSDWEFGWNENFQTYKNNSSTNSLIPKYIKKSNIFRINGKLALSDNEDFENILTRLHHQAIGLKFLKDFDYVYEFGCGTGINLLSFNQIFPSKKYIGLDWVNSSKNIINELKKNNPIQLNFETYDFYKPHRIDFEKNSAVCTITSLEQVGSDFKNFIDVLIESRPGIVIHMEPIIDWYNKDNQHELLSIQYHIKRGYLDGLLKYLEELESKKIISILSRFKTQFGESRHNPFSLISWRPN